MEVALETYQKPYDPKRPVLCMDEHPVQLIKETRKPIAATRKHPWRVDCEYEREGTANIFMFTEPLPGWREARARPHHGVSLHMKFNLAILLLRKRRDGHGHKTAVQSLVQPLPSLLD